MAGCCFVYQEDPEFSYRKAFVVSSADLLQRYAQSIWAPFVYPFLPSIRSVGTINSKTFLLLE